MLLVATIFCLAAGVAAAYGTVYLPAHSAVLERCGGVLLITGLVLLVAGLRPYGGRTADQESPPTVSSGQRQ
jgi:hypothetical protein